MAKLTIPNALKELQLRNAQLVEIEEVLDKSRDTSKSVIVPREALLHLHRDYLTLYTAVQHDGRLEILTDPNT